MAVIVLVINESPSMRQFISAILNGAGFDTIEANDADAARTKIGRQKIEVIVSDMDLPNFNGIRQVNIRSLFARRICHG